MDHAVNGSAFSIFPEPLGCIQTGGSLFSFCSFYRLPHPDSGMGRLDKP
jgi:hypothetical protein